MPGKEHKRQGEKMSCSEFDALLSQAIDGTLAGERLAAFEEHGRECELCGPLMQEAESGRSWLKSLGEAEPPQELVSNILMRTSGLVSAQRLAGGPQTVTFPDTLRQWATTFFAPLIAVARQPRFAMSFGMAFFTLSVTLSLAGVRLSDLRHIDLRPSAIRRTYYETTGRVEKYYENIRFVYEIESRVRQFKEATAPAERRPEQPSNNERKDKSKNDNSGQPEQKQERNYSQGASQLIYASLSHEPPAVSEATYRRFV